MKSHKSVHIVLTVIAIVTLGFRLGAAVPAGFEAVEAYRTGSV